MVLCGYLLFVLTLLLPLGMVICRLFGYTFELASVGVLAAVTALISAALCILSINAERPQKGGAFGAIMTFLTPLSIVNAAFVMLESPEVWVVVSVFIHIGCSAYLTMKYGACRPLKISLSIISAVLILPVVFMGFISLVFGGIGQNTVVQTVESPSGAYCAKVMDIDQGALGGDTAVDVYEKDDLNLWAFRIFKTPKRVYQGEWGAFEDMEIYWKDDRYLVINSVEYPME